MRRKKKQAIPQPKVRLIHPVIDLNEEIIARATRKNSRHCMIAEAIKEQFPAARLVSVDLQTIRWSDNKKKLRYTFLTPRAAQDALVRFDRGEKIPAFTLRLRSPHITSTSTGGKGYAKGKKKKTFVHNLGKRRIHALKADKRAGTVPAQIGGKGAPLDKNHPSHSSRREYGLRAYTLQDLVPTTATPAKLAAAARTEA